MCSNNTYHRVGHKHEANAIMPFLDAIGHVHQLVRILPAQLRDSIDMSTLPTLHCLLMAWWAQTLAALMV